MPGLVPAIQGRAVEWISAAVCCPTALQANTQASLTLFCRSGQRLPPLQKRPRRLSSDAASSVCIFRLFANRTHFLSVRHRTFRVASIIYKEPGGLKQEQLWSVDNPVD